jgi:hypothetical protein
MNLIKRQVASSRYFCFRFVASFQSFQGLLFYGKESLKRRLFFLCLMERRMVVIVDDGGYTITLQVLSLSDMHFGERDSDGTYTQWGDQQVNTIVFYSC